MDVQPALKTLEEFELKVAEFYGWLREAYADDAEASLVFHRMHLEEKGHAYLVQFARRLVRQNPKLFRGVDLDLEDINQALPKVTDAMRKGLAPDLGQVVRLGVEIEAHVADLLYRKVIRHPDQEAFRLLGALGSTGGDHRCVLCEFGRKRGYLRSRAGAPCPVAEAASACRWKPRGTPRTTPAGVEYGPGRPWSKTAEESAPSARRDDDGWI